MSDPNSLEHIQQAPNLQESSPVKLIQSRSSLDSNKIPAKRGQLFAKQKYFSKKNQEPSTPVKQSAKPFKPYDLTKSPPKPLKLRKITHSLKTLHQVLQERKIDLISLINENSYLPLEPFCSSQYDFISTDEYLKKLRENKTMTASLINLEAEGLNQKINEELGFQDAVLLDEQVKKQYQNDQPTVTTTKQEKSILKGFWVKSDPGYKMCFRWQILFEGEDIENWLTKIVKACESRKLMDALLRYNYYVDNMPVEDIAVLQTHLQLGMIDKIAFPFDKSELDPLMEEANNWFVRLQNQVLFKKLLGNNSESQKMFSKEIKLNFKKKKAYREFGRIQFAREKQLVVLDLGKVLKTQAKTFDEKFKAFGLASLYSNKEILSALDLIKKECLQLKLIDIFDTNFVSGYVKLQDFKHSQEHYVHKGIRRIVDIFPSKIYDIIKNELKIGKDNKCNIIPQQKFRKFLELVQHTMKDSLIDCFKSNFYGFYRMIAAYLPDSIAVKSAGQVKNIYSQIQIDDSATYEDIKHSTKQIIKKHFPLFCIMLKINEEETGFTYTLSPKDFTDLFHSYFEKILVDLNNILDLQSKLLPKYENYQIVKQKLKLTVLPVDRPSPLEIRSGVLIDDENLWIWELFDQFKKDLELMTDPLSEYLGKYSQYKEFLLFDVKKELERVQADETKEIRQIKDDIEFNRKRQKQIKKEIIEKIQVGVFDIETKEICDYIMEKYGRIAKGLQNVIANRVIKSTQEQLQQFAEMEARIKKLTVNIEEASELKDFLDVQAKSQVEKIRVQITKNAQVYALLEEYHFKFEPREIQNRWTIYKKPKDIYDMIYERLDKIEREKKKYEQEMYQEQEEFKKLFQSTEKVIHAFHTNNSIANHDSIISICSDIMKKLQHLAEQSRKFNSRQMLFSLDPTDYSKLQAVTKEFTPYNTLWTIVHRWYTDIDTWMDNPFKSIDANAAEKFVEESARAIVQANRAFKEKNMNQIVAIGQKVRGEMDKFKPNLPLMVSLRKQGMKDRHWAEVQKLAGVPINPQDEEFTFRKILQLGLLKHVDACTEIGQKAAKEYNIETMLKEMWGIWDNINFDLADYKAGTSIIRGYDDIQAILDEHIVNTQVIQFSAFKKPFEAEIITWYDELKTVSDVMQEWMKCQGQWMYLQPIFDSGDISKQLPAESKKFRSVDNVWKANINLAKQFSNVKVVCCTEGLLAKIKESNDKLQQIQKSLNEYLEKKRERFARFYFLSNDDLLQILSQTKEPTAVQPHLKKVFQNIHSIEFNYKKHITAMFSAEKQKVDFVDFVNPNEKNVEDWMNEVEDMMKQSVRYEFQRSIDLYPETKRTEWTCNHPGQCVLNGSQVWWTTLVEEALKGNKIEEYFKKSTDQLHDLVDLVRQPLTKQQQVTINALIVLDVHAKDVVEKLVVTGVKDIGAFEWISQLRYYWTGDCYVRCVQTNFPYGYEYLGNTLRLVITPLTDKCYMTLMGALKLNLGGAPAGPAGTGKTESTKDLAKALAKQCVVFNCSDSMDYIMIGKFFKGLASAGAWCCFDEFNRINIQVLSVIAQQLLILFGQKAKGSSSCDFEGSHIKILPTFCVFITMNPGYAGRTQLPDNLKALFRSVAMMVPDYALIGQIMLYSFGFTKGRDLAKKMVATFKLSSEQLSSQDHYDYGMRAVRSVINAAGLLKAATPDMDEDQLLLRALRDVNVPKFLQEDLPLFQNIITDLFPGIERPKIDYGELLDAIKAQTMKINLQPVRGFIDKVLQLYDTIQVRHGLMLVGPTGGGKTSTEKVLSSSMTSLEKKGQAKVHLHKINPKSIKMGQLYGQFNDQTHEWADGILAYRVRECVRDQSSDKHWIVFDGPVDSLWIQSMNTVLDDNKKLCLNSGQILTLTPHMTMMFEVQDLAVASPATVSRCGMVYMQPNSIGLQPLIQSWFKVLPDQFKERTKFIGTLKNLFKQFLEPCVEFVRINCKELVVSSDGNLVQSLMRILNCFFENYKETQVKKVTEEEYQHLQSVIQKLFHWGLVWSVGCTTNLEGRQKFNIFLKELDTKKMIKVFPDQLTVYDYEFKEKEKEWVDWSKSFEKFEVDQRLMYHEIAIPTKDSARNLYLTKLLITHNFHVLTLGPTGTGKSLNCSELLISGLNDTYQYIGLAFSAQTGANQTQDTIDSKMQKRRRGYFGPPIGKKCIIFIDDLNMPKKQTYGAQPPIQLVRQYCDHKGWYDRKTLLFMNVEDLYILCTMGPPGGGRTFITNRVIRHFNMLAYTDLSNDIITHIFSSLLSFYMKKFPEATRSFGKETSKACLKIFDFVKKELLPTPSKSHYTFNLRDIWKVVQGICSVHTKNIINSRNLINLWYHENSRVFHDRLVSTEDKNMFIQAAVRIGRQLQAAGNKKEEEPKENAEGEEGEKKEEEENKKQQEVEQPKTSREFSAKRIVFADFMTGREGQSRPYVEVQDLKKMIQKIQEYLEEYNAEMGTKKAMKLVMFLDACEHIARISRIIRQPQGNALLLGVGGSGRQSLSKVATFVMGYSMRQIEVIKNYSMKNWREDIKDILLNAGVQNKPLSFLFVDTQIINEQMLEDINNILNSGDVANIYNDKDMEDIVTSCKADCVKKNLQPNKMNIFSMYLARVKRNIHIIIAMSPIGDAFATRLRMFPSLVNGSTIDWFSEWPEEALLGVGKGQLLQVQIQLGLEGKLDSLVQVFKTVHKSVQKQSITFKAQLNRINHVTPTIYLQLLQTYKRVLKEKKNQSTFSISRLQNGLDQLFQANKAVEDMQVQLTDMQPKLQKASVETEKLMQKLTVDKAEAEEVQTVVSAQEKIANAQKAQASQLAAEAEASVAEANQSLQITLAEVKKLKKDHLNEIKALANPPNVIRVVLGGVVILLQDKIKQAGGSIVIKNVDGKKEEDYFETAKKSLLNDVTTLMKELLEYKKESINPALIKKLQDKIMSDSEFTLERAKTASYAIQFLFLWVKAMYDFNKVFNETKPLREKLEATQQLLAEKTAFLKEKMDALDAVNQKIKILEETFTQKIEEKERLTNEIEMCKVKLERAKKLISGLSDEQSRWSKDVKRLQGESELIAGNSIIGAGMIAYSGPFTAQYRTRMQKLWEDKMKSMEIPHTQGINMRSFLGVPVVIQQWNISGLPKDDTSTQNGVIIDKTRRWPLMIDPQSQANKFIKNLGANHEEGLNVAKTTEANLMRTLQLAIQFGKWVILEGVGKDLDPSLQPVLLQNVVKTGSSYSITIGQKTINYSQSFKFFMTTTLPNPHYPPQIFVKVSIINFAITPSGLEEQMLAQIVALQNPQLQQKKLDIVIKNAQDKKTLIEIEDSILKALSSTGGNIDEFLKDQSLINQLSNSKKTSQEINKRVQESKATQQQIDQTRQGYRPVAYRASLLFFCIIDFAFIDPMYQYSLQWFVRLFVLSVQSSTPSNVLEERLASMNDYFTYSLYENVCRSLFERHKLLFSFVMTIKIMQGDDKIDLQQWRYLLSGPSGEIQVPANPTDWIPENQWPDFYRQFYGTGQLQKLKGIQDHFMKNHADWRRLFDSTAPQQEKLPAPYDEDLNIFQKIIIIKSIRPDKVIPSVQNYVTEIMGERYIVAPTFELSKCYRDSSVVTPLIFVLSAGSDPVADFLKFAEQMNMTERYRSISLGQGQGKKAKALVETGSSKGYWVLLQNCHLSISWMPQLQLVCEAFKEDMHKDFRLWLTSMPTSSFSIPILQNSIKMTLQPPQGLRNNLLRTYKNMDDRELADCQKEDEFKKILFGFCLFHAIVQDRRKFGPIGWNIAYQFTNEDLVVCKKQLKMLLDDYEEIPYKVLNFLGAEINYGGRVTDDKDVRLITTIIKVYVNSDVIKVGHKFSESGIYKQPQANSIDQFVQYIERLPLNPSPQAFGLHDNAQITNSQNQTFSMLESILSVQPKTGSGGGKSRDQVISEIATFVQSKTPQVFPLWEIQKKYPTSYEESMNTVLVQEVIRYNRLLAVMKQNLVDVKKALKGLIVMSEELQLLANSLFDNQVPKIWDQKGFLSMKPLASWTEDLNARIEFLQVWIDEGTPKCFWISGFFFPQAFLTGTLQNFARRHIIAIDKLSFEFKYLDIEVSDVTEKPEDGCYIHGLFLEGARWNTEAKLIKDPQPKQLYSNLPMMHLIPLPDRKVPETGIYNCPVYKVVSRRGTLSTTGHSTNFVMFFEMPTQKAEDEWIRAGVAAFLALRY